MVMVWNRLRSNKFGNETRLKCPFGHSHRSKLEIAVCMQYHARMQAGEIAKVEVEQHIRICGPPGHDCRTNARTDLIIDFVLTRPDGSVFYGEAKGGFETPLWRAKRRAWIHNDIGHMEIWSGTYQRTFLKEVLGDA